MVTLRGVMLGIFLGCFATYASADIILNGSFEDPAVTAGSGLNFPGGSTSLTGWTILGSDVHVLSTSFVQGNITFNAHSGVQWLDLSGFSSNSKDNGVMQNVATIAGQDYSLSFFVGSMRNGAFFPSTVDLRINDGTRMSFTNPATPNDHLEWLQFTTQFTATSAVTNIKFLNGSEPNNFVTALDTVSMNPVTAVPEPGSGTLLGLAMTAAYWIRRRFAK